MKRFLLLAPLLVAFGNPTGADLPAAEEEVKTIAQFFPATWARYAHPYYWSPFILMGDWR